MQPYCQTFLILKTLRELKTWASDIVSSQTVFKGLQRVLLLVLGAEVDPKDVRIPGVLQRLAATYFVVGLMEVVFARVDDRYEVTMGTRAWFHGASFKFLGLGSVSAHMINARL